MWEEKGKSSYEVCTNRNTGCHCIRRDFSSTQDISEAAFDIILSASDNMLSTDQLVSIAPAFDIPRLEDSLSEVSNQHTLRQVKQAITHEKASTCLVSVDADIVSVETIFKNFEKMSKESLVALAAQHNLRVSPWSDRELLKDLIMSHLANGHCIIRRERGCSALVNGCNTGNPCLDGDEVTIKFLEIASKKISARRPMERLLQTCNVSCTSGHSLAQLQKSMKAHIKTLKKGKRSAVYGEKQEVS